MQKTPPLMDSLTTDLSLAAQQGKLDPLIAREGELNELIRVLSGGECYAILIGGRGIGKTAIVEGLAQRISDANVPNSLRLTKVKQLDWGRVALMAQRDKFQRSVGQFAEELSLSNSILYITELDLILEELKRDVILLIETLMNWKNILCIGAMTPPAFQQWQESDQGIAERFQAIYVRRLSIEETILILQEGKRLYEDHHQLEITDEAIRAAANLSRKHFPDVELPGKAFDLIDEAAAQLRFSKRPSSRIPRIEVELAAIIEELQQLSAQMTEEQRNELKTRESELTSDLATLRENAQAGEPKLRVTGQEVADVITSWLQDPAQ